MAKRFDVLAAGELNPDLILSGIGAGAPVLGTEQAFTGETLTLGSSTAICCVLLQRLGLRTAMAARVGRDDHGAFCTDALTREGVDVSGVQASPGSQTGITISLAYPEDRMLLTRYGAMAEFAATDISRGLVASARHLHVGSFFIQDALRPGLPELFAYAQEQGLSTSLDLGWDPKGTWDTSVLEDLLPHTSVILPNQAELAGITGTNDIGEGLDRLHRMGAAEIALKLGRKGGLASIGGDLTRCAPFRVTPVDTTGAGDAFNAGYLAARLEGKDPAARLKLANACGALTAAAIGGTGGFSSRAEAEQLANTGLED